MLFVQIMLGVLAAFAIIVAIVAWWFWRTFKRTGHDFQAISALPLRFQLPARLTLHPTSLDDIDEQWQPWNDLGFRKLADYSGEVNLRLAARADHLVLALLTRYGDRPVRFVLFALTTVNEFYAVENSDEGVTQAGKLTWHSIGNTTPELAIERFRELIGVAHPRPPADWTVKALTSAYAARMDALLREPPVADELRQRTEAMKLTQAQVDLAISQERLGYTMQLEAALLDHFRRSYQGTVADWERIREDIHVVHSHLLVDELLELIDVEDDSPLSALVGEGPKPKLSPILIYERWNASLPAAQRRELVGEVARPVHARFFALREGALGETVSNIVYRAADAEGKSISGVIAAHDAGDARTKLVAQGYADIQVMTDPNPVDLVDMDPAQAEFAVKLLTDPLWKNLLRAVGYNWWLWLIPAIWLCTSLLGSRPFGWGDYLGFTIAAVVAISIAILILPMALYGQLQSARVFGRHRQAKSMIHLLRFFPSAAKRSQLAVEWAKVIADEGQLAAALEHWRAYENSVGPEEYAQGLSGIYDAVGHFPNLIEQQRRMVTIAQSRPLAELDLALTLMRSGVAKNAAEASDLVARSDFDSLSELGKAAYFFVRGMVLASNRQHQAAIAQLQQAIQGLAAFKGTPLMQALVAEATAHLACSLKAIGAHDKAQAMFDSVYPVIRHQKICVPVIARYRS